MEVYPFVSVQPFISVRYICNIIFQPLFSIADINYCSKSEPCLHGGTCISDLEGNYTCLCPERYAGPNCEHALCYEGYCQNGGLCKVSPVA